MEKQWKRGFSLVELMVAVAIIPTILAGGYSVLKSGQSAWENTDTQIQLGASLRQTIERISKEMRETGSAGGVMQMTISDGAGGGGSDVLTFSMPIVCQQGGSVIDTEGDVAYWGAPLTWGCVESSCMDADDDCATVDYKFVEYRIDAEGQLLRSVLDGEGSLVRREVFAQDVLDMQAALSADQRVVTLTVTASRDTKVSGIMTLSNTVNIYLRNKG